MLNLFYKDARSSNIITLLAIIGFEDREVFFH